MSSSLNHGLTKPANGDTGETFFPQLAANVQYQSDILSNTSSAAAASWGSDLGGGTYRQLITLPALLTISPKSYVFDDLLIKVRDASGNVCYPTILKASSTTFYIYTNDTSQTFTINYGT